MFKRQKEITCSMCEINQNTLRAAPEVQFDACISGVDAVYKEEDLVNFHNKHKSVYDSLKCYSKPDSLSNTCEVSLSPHPYRRLFNPSLWDSGICVKRFVNTQNTSCVYIYII